MISAKKKLYCPANVHQAPVVQKVDNAIHRINHYPLDIAIGFAITYPVDSDLSGGKHYPSFEQLGPDVQIKRFWFQSANRLEVKVIFGNSPEPIFVYFGLRVQKRSQILVP